ncbi:MFS transporter [Streptomyces gilvosporeus]|uniref:alpha-amylase n=2 Tax=Streptomyces gilvosporeus TaxID=553510 RepID=A0A1V0U4A5_9ACTN|nr:MFS transporter [Streptomyces gilvosporeus]ARF59838.1 MFS transporter [Streptomyces gilvosporeus]
MPALLLVVLDQTALAPALPAIARELHGLPVTPWAVTAYLLAAALGLPVHGALGDLFGRKPALLLAILAFTVGSASAGWSRSMGELLAFRALQGLGGGGLLLGALAVTATLVPPRSRRRCRGLIAVALGLAFVAGPLAGGLLADHASWRWGCFLTAPFGVLAFLVVATRLRLPKPGARPRRDLAGALLLTVCAICLGLLASWGGGAYAWTSTVVLGLGAGALAAALLFLVAERFAAAPLLPPRLLRDCLVGITGLVGAVLALALHGALGGLPDLARTAGDATEAGLLTVPLLLGIVLAALVSGRLIVRTGHHRIFPLLGCAVAAEGMWLLTRTAQDAPYGAHGLGTGLLGLGIGFVLPVLVLAVRNSACRYGAACRATTTARWLGGSIGVGLFWTLAAARLTGQLTPHLAASAHAVPEIVRCLAPLLALGFLLALFLKEKPLVSHTSAATSATPMPHLPYGDAESSPAGVPRARTAANSYGAHAGYAASSAGVPVCGTVQHHDGSIVPRAALTLIDNAGRQVGRGATGEDGRYALGTPGAGSYVLIAAAGGHQPQAVTVTVGERPVELDVVLGGAGRLAGTVTTGDGTPVRDAMVTLTDVRGEVVATTRSGREGGYVIGELVAGEYTLASSAPAFRPAALPVTVHASRETRQDIELAGGAVLRGTVRAGGGRPVEDARVTLLDAAGNVVDTATTGPDGLFRFVDLSAGEYTVIAAGYPPVATVLQVAGGGRTERDLQLGHED